MAKTKISEYDSTASANTDIDSINIDEGCAPSGINNAIREVMAHLKDFQAGLSGDTLPIASGGTGSTTAGGARTALGAGTTGASVFQASTVADAQQAMDVEVGVDVQAYDADTLVGDTAKTLTAPFRGTVTTDNDLSFDQDVTNNFSCTPTAGGTLTFTNHTAGQSGYVLLDNSAGVAITAHATTKITATDLTTISTAGVYLISYFDNGTNAYCTVSASYA